MRRRHFLVGALATIATAPRLAQAKIQAKPQRLSLYHTHTSESLDIVVDALDPFPLDARRRLNHFLRDFRTDEVHRIDPKLFKLLARLKHRTGNPDGVIEIISAYRSPKTNEMLRGKNKGSGVARKSLHMQGMALDIRLRGTSTASLRDHAIALQGGGVGYYRRSDFIHVDTGRVRRW
jgi:uncharacterized protein YcbK (DUF882 family)